LLQASNLVPNWCNQLHKVKTNTGSAPEHGLLPEHNTLPRGDAGDNLQPCTSSQASHITHTLLEIHMTGDLEYGSKFDQDESAKTVQLV